MNFKTTEPRKALSLLEEYLKGVEKPVYSRDVLDQYYPTQQNKGTQAETQTAPQTGTQGNNSLADIFEQIFGGNNEENNAGNIIGDAIGGIKDTVSDAVNPGIGNDNTYDPYVESDAVKAAKDALAQQMAQKPGAYQSQWQTSLDEAISKILNREEFKYDLNGDMLYNQYKDQYINQGRQAMMDAIGRTSALTGGFANSWAQSAGQQTFQGYLQQLNEKIPELYQLAMDRYNMAGEQLMDKLAVLLEREGQDYNRWRDQMSDYLTERDYLTGRYDTERNYDYNIFTDNRDFNYQVDRDNVSDEQWQAEFDEAIRQYLASADPEVRAAYNSLGGNLGALGGTSGLEGLLGMGSESDMISAIINGLGSAGGGKVFKVTSSGSKSSGKKSTSGDIVDQVIRGDFGNGQARKDALKKAGYSDAEIKQIQAEVNKRMAGVTADDDDTVVPSTDTGKENLDKYDALYKDYLNAKKNGSTDAEIKADLQNLYNENKISYDTYINLLNNLKLRTGNAR